MTSTVRPIGRRTGRCSGPGRTQGRPLLDDVGSAGSPVASAGHGPSWQHLCREPLLLTTSPGPTPDP